MTDKIRVKDVRQFVRKEYHLYESGGEPYKEFQIALRAGPNVERYLVKVDGCEPKGFTKLGDAVRYFNDN